MAWFQSRYDKAGPGGSGADYINCPLDAAQYEAFVAALLAGEKTEFKEWESDALFRGLPADRGDGGARARDAALRADEAGRADRSAHRPAAATRSCSCARTTRSARCTTWSASRPSSSTASRSAIFRMIPGLERRRVRAPRRPAPQHLHQQPAPARRRAAPAGAAAPALRRPDHRRRGLCRERRDRAARRALRRRRARWAQRRRRRRATTALGALLGHITGGADARDLPADERQFRPVSAARRKDQARPTASRRWRAARWPISTPGWPGAAEAA